MAPPHGSAGLAAVLGAALLAALVAPAASGAAVLCVKAHKDGTLGGVLRLRDGSCAKREVEVDPAALGLCCGEQATTTVTVTSTSICPTYTTSTLGIPDCQPGLCSPYGCTNGRECVMGQDGLCGCTGPLVSCRALTVDGQCGGTCPQGLVCRTVQPVGEDGCPGPPTCGCAPAAPVPCGPTLTCDPETEMCVSHGPVGPAVVYECRDVPAGCEVDRTCACASGTLCVAPFDVCTDVGPDAIHCECPQCQ
jgi:hypothetical protein